MAWSLGIHYLTVFGIHRTAAVVSGVIYRQFCSQDVPSALEMLHDNALYKFNIDTDIDIDTTVYCSPVSWSNAVWLLNWNLHCSTAGTALMTLLLLPRLLSTEYKDGDDDDDVACCVTAMSWMLQRSSDAEMPT